jgi:hypothetical protein
MGPGIILVIGSVDKFERKKNRDERRVAFYLFKKEALFPFSVMGFSK